MKDKSYSAISNAALRAAESYYPEDERLFYDEAAFNIMPPLWKLFLKLMKFAPLREMIYAKRDKEMPGVIGNLLYRTKYIDDILRDNLKEMEQILILGAGFDTRALRIEGIDSLKVFEVDHPQTISQKKKGLKNISQELPEHLSLVEIDFEERNLKEVLQENNFDTDKKTFVICEGVTQYLEKEAVDRILNYFADLKSGSKVLFSYIKKEVVDGSERSEVDQKIISFVEKVGSPWKTGIKSTEIGEILKTREMDLIEDVGREEYIKRYSHLTDREIRIYDGERIAYAEKAASRPSEVEEHWNKEYSEIDTASNKIRILEENGFSPLGYFYLPEASWFDNYYGPMEERFEDFLSYGFYIAQKLD